MLQCSYLVLFQKINDVYGPVALALLKKTDSAQRETKKNTNSGDKHCELLHFYRNLRFRMSSQNSFSKVSKVTDSGGSKVQSLLRKLVYVVCDAWVRL